MKSAFVQVISLRTKLSLQIAPNFQFQAAFSAHSLSSVDYLLYHHLRQTHDSDCEHRTLTNLLFKLPVYDGNPIRWLKGFIQIVGKLRGLILAQYKVTQDYFEIWICKATLVQSESPIIEQEHSRSTLNCASYMNILISNKYKFITSWVHSLYKEILLFLIPQLYNLDNSFALISILYVVLYKKINLISYTAIIREGITMK